MTSIITSGLRGFDWFVLGYFVALNSIYLALVVAASFELGGAMRRERFSGYEELFANPLTPAVSVLVPAFNEAAVIVDSVDAMLSLRYPDFEVVVVDDGSTDETFDNLRRAFDLAEVERAIPNHVRTVGAVRSVHAPRDGRPLVVVRKDNAGSRADALNAALNVSRHPLVCMVDADSQLEEGALLRVAKPFVDDPEQVVAVGGVVRPANGSTVEAGRVADARLPRGWLERMQVVEYLRSFLLGRAGWSRFGGLLIISGAFGLFRRDLVVAVGGLDPASVGEDADLVASIHQHLRDEKRRYRIVFVSEPVCWTEIPRDRRVLGVQRRRWSRGLAQLAWKHRRMIGNPRYGRVGLVVLPYYVAFELLGPIVEVIGVASVVLGVAVGAVGTPFVRTFALFAVAYAVLLSVVAVAVEEFSYHRYGRWRDLMSAFVAAAFENFGYRQLCAWWRLRGLLSHASRRPVTWGRMPRAGFTRAPGADEPRDAPVPEEPRRAPVSAR